MRKKAIFFAGALVALMAFQAPFSKVKIIDAKALPFSGGGYRAPTGTTYTIRMVAPAGHKDFKALGLGVGAFCLPASIRIEEIGRPVEVFFRGDTISIVATYIKDAPLPMTPCDYEPAKGKEGKLGLLMNGKELTLDIEKFALPDSTPAK
jgi:hypothetical protein